LSEKADSLELVEEQIWQWFCYYQGQSWDGKIEYPDSFAIRDTQNEIAQLKMAKETATDPRVIEIIDQKLLTALGEDPDMIRDTPNAADIPAQPPFDVHVMIDPATGEEFYARTEQEHLAYAARGFVHRPE
jgi:hypothetical protein